MKKYIFLIIVFAISILLMPFSYSQVHAKEPDELNITTIYPEDILDYKDLSNIKSFDIIDDKIAYTLDNTSINIYNLKDRTTHTISGFYNIKQIKFVNNQILVIDNNKIKVINDLNITTANGLASFVDISTSSDFIDIYVSDKIYVGTVEDDTFKLYVYNLDFTPPKTNPVNVSQSTYYSNCYMLSINSSHSYIVYKKSEVANTITTGICILGHTTDNPVIYDNFVVNTRLIETFEYNDKEYIMTFTTENLDLQYLHNNQIFSIKDGKGHISIGDQQISEENPYPILSLSDIEFYKDTIYVSDNYYKTIQTYKIINTITNDENIDSLKSDKIILSSEHYDIGRFNKIDNILLHNDIIYTADTGNNRIQYIDNSKPYILNESLANSNIHSVEIDRYNNMYYITDNVDYSILNKYSYTNTEFTNYKSFYEINGNKIGLVSSICSTRANNIYMLDYSNNRLLYLSDNSIMSKGTLAIPLNKFSKIEYIKDLDMLTVLSDNKIYLLNLQGQIQGNYIEINNCNNITTDLSAIYAMTDTEINLINIRNNSLELTTKSISSNKLSDIKNCTFDIIGRKMYGFDSKRSCLVYFDCELTPLAISQIDISKTDTTINETNVLPLGLNDYTLIYEYPFELGTLYNRDNSIKEVIGVEDYNIYYRVIFESNNNITSGYVPKSSTVVKTTAVEPLKVLTTNQVVPIYKYPTLLKYNNERIINAYLPINTKITLQYAYPVSIDNRTFYMYRKDNIFGFILSSDVVLDEENNIRVLLTENAEIKLLESDNISLLSMDKQTTIVKLNNHSRIHVEHFDKNSEYTLISYTDNNLNVYTGYIPTEYIQMDKLDNTQIALILIIIISIILLAIIVITYFILKKKHK